MIRAPGKVIYSCLVLVESIADTYSWFVSVVHLKRRDVTRLKSLGLPE